MLVHNKTQQNAWVMLETLLSLALFALLLTLLHKQSQVHWQSLYKLEKQHDQMFQQNQIDRLRIMRQNKEWLLGTWSPVNELNCLTCQNEQLNDWVISWLAKGDKDMVIESFLGESK